MTKEAALKAFWSSFSETDGSGHTTWIAYPNTAVPENAEYKYLTYPVTTDSIYGEPVSFTIQLWDYTTQESPLNAKVREIADAIGPGGVALPCDGGYIWLTRGFPWCINATGEGDNRVKVRQLNVTAEFLTEN